MTYSSVRGPGLSLGGPRGPRGLKGDAPAHEIDGLLIRWENPDGTWGPWIDLNNVVGLEFMGDWSASENYDENKLVAHGNSIYISLQPNVNSEPGTDPADWSVFIVGGTVGDGALTEPKLSDALANIFVRRVAGHDDIAAFTPSRFMALSIIEDGKEGIFNWVSGDFSSAVASDPRGGVYVESSLVSASTGAWVRSDRIPLRPEWFKLSTDTSDSECVEACLALGFALQMPVLLTRMYACHRTIDLPGTFGAGSSSGFSVAMEGLGESTGFYHDFNAPLFECDESMPAIMRFCNFKVVSRSAKTPGSNTFMFNGGLLKSLFQTIRIGHNDTPANAPAGLFDCGQSSVTDTIVFDDCHIEGIVGTGIGIGSGSSIWVRGGRIIGMGTPAEIGGMASVGIKMYGGNGGIWINDCDVINLNVAIHVTSLNGTSNREVFLNGACIDSSYVGLAAEDNSYIEWDGIWASSCGVANLLFLNTFGGIFVGTGGNVFNAGAVPGGAGDGITINGGEIRLTGVLIRNNTGRGVRCPAAVVGTMTGCTIRNNNIGFDASGIWSGDGNNIYDNVNNLIRNAADLRRFVAGKSHGAGTYTTDGAGEFIVPHGLGMVPVYADASSLGNIAGESQVVNFDSVNLRIRVRDTTTNASAASMNVDVMWSAVA